MTTEALTLHPGVRESELAGWREIGRGILENTAMVSVIWNPASYKPESYGEYSPWGHDYRAIVTGPGEVLSIHQPVYVLANERAFQREMYFGAVDEAKLAEAERMPHKIDVARPQTISEAIAYEDKVNEALAACAELVVRRYAIQNHLELRRLGGEFQVPLLDQPLSLQSTAPLAA